MIKNGKLLLIAVIFLIASMALNFPFPNANPFGETVVSVFDIPIQSVNGWQYKGISSFILLVASLVFLTRSLNKYKGRMVLFTILISMFLPIFLANSYQKTFAKGIYAVSYKSDSGNCRFEMKNKTTLHGVCTLPFKNYSSRNVKFMLKFYDCYKIEENAQMETLMNNNATYKIRLMGNESKKVIIESDIDVSKMKSHIDSGEVSGVYIIIKSGTKSRSL